MKIKKMYLMNNRKFNKRSMVVLLISVIGLLIAIGFYSFRKTDFDNSLDNLVKIDVQKKILDVNLDYLLNNINKRSDEINKIRILVFNDYFKDYINHYDSFNIVMKDKLNKELVDNLFKDIDDKYNELKQELIKDKEVNFYLITKSDYFKEIYIKAIIIKRIQLFLSNFKDYYNKLNYYNSHLFVFNNLNISSINIDFDKKYVDLNLDDLIFKYYENQKINSKDKNNILKDYNIIYSLNFKKQLNKDQLNNLIVDYDLKIFTKDVDDCDSCNQNFIYFYNIIKPKLNVNLLDSIKPVKLCFSAKLKNKELITFIKRENMNNEDNKENKYNLKIQFIKCTKKAVCDLKNLFIIYLQNYESNKGKINQYELEKLNNLIESIKNENKEDFKKFLECVKNRQKTKIVYSERSEPQPEDLKISIEKCIL